MNNAQRFLFGEFPRTVASKKRGELKQHFVHSESEFDLFFDYLSDERDLYSSICTFDPEVDPVVGDVAFDFDSPMKETYWSDSIPENEKIQRMREDESVAEAILGDVWSDTRSLVEKCLEEGIPVITVFSGMGIHCHVLYKPQFKPEDKKISTSKWLIEECDLDTWDRQILTDLRRVLRIPNSKRFEYGEFTGVYNIPITEREVMENSIHDLLERSKNPKDIPDYSRYKIRNRPEMEMKEGYEDAGVKGDTESPAKKWAEEVEESGLGIDNE